MGNLAHRLSPLVYMRSCGKCTKCCDGWLVASVEGQEIKPGSPCRFADKGCGIYKNRPENPCKTFSCQWLIDDSIPEWVKPDVSKIIICKREISGIEYLKAEPAGDNSPSVQFLSWFVIWGLAKNICWTVENKNHFFGSQDFVNAMQAMLDSENESNSESEVS